MILYNKIKNLKMIYLKKKVNIINKLNNFHNFNKSTLNYYKKIMY